MNTLASAPPHTLQAPPCVLRPWRESDVASLVRFGNNRGIWRNLAAGFPHPYTEERAREWVAFTQTMQPERQFAYAIELNGEAIGGTGYERLPEVERRVAQLGYWLGEPFWGRGIATAVVNALTAHLFSDPAVQRCQAYVYAWNPASARVLEKAGYRLEGRMCNAVYKDGEVTDKLIYGKVRP